MDHVASCTCVFLNCFFSFECTSGCKSTGSSLLLNPSSNIVKTMVCSRDGPNRSLAAKRRCCWGSEVAGVSLTRSLVHEAPARCQWSAYHVKRTFATWLPDSNSSSLPCFLFIFVERRMQAAPSVWMSSLGVAYHVLFLFPYTKWPDICKKFFFSPQCLQKWSKYEKIIKVLRMSLLLLIFVLLS